MTEIMQRHIKNIAERFQLTVVILDNCKFEFLEEDGSPIGSDDDYFEDAP